MPSVLDIFSRSRAATLAEADRVLSVQRAAQSAPAVVWAAANGEETPAAFAQRCAAAREASALVLAVVPHGTSVPEGVRAVELPRKHFRVLHPARRARFRVLKGGRGAAKSWSIARVLVVEALRLPLSILCCREIQNSIRASVHRLLANQIRSLGLQAYYDIDLRQIRAFNGSTFDFEGLYANIDRIKSFEGADIVWIEEAESISAASWEMLEPTLRKSGSFFVANYNPDSASAPTHEMFAVHPRPDALVQHVDYRDNPWLSAELRKSMEYLRAVDYDAYRHVWEGETRAFSDAQILKGKFTVEDFDVCDDWSGPHIGLDFGFSQDPTAAVRCYVAERTLYISHEAWGLRTDIDATPRLLDTLGEDARRHTIRADGARPESISYLQRHGYPGVTAAPKWPGSVEDGVAFLRQFERIVIHTRCEHVLEEARLYSFKVDRLSGAVLPDIVDKFNHCMDALRYALAPLIKTGGADALLSYYQAEYARAAAPTGADKPAPVQQPARDYPRVVIDRSDPHHVVERVYLGGMRPPGYEQ